LHLARLSDGMGGDSTSLCMLTADNGGEVTQVRECWQWEGYWVGMPNRGAMGFS